MNTSTFLTTLRSHPALPLVFQTAGDTIPAGYHLTEVKRVAYETMDCGGMTHAWAETQFEIWVPPLADLTPGRDYLPAAKFLRILERVEQKLPLDGTSTARIHAGFADHPAALYEIDSVHASDGRLRVELRPDRTRCKSAERRLAAPGGGCCASVAEETISTPAAGSAAGGCGTAERDPVGVAGCA